LLIVADTSALIAIALGEADAPRLSAAFAAADDVIMSAGTLHETLVVAELRGVRRPVERLLSVVRIAPLTERDAVAAADAYAAWGKGRHPAGLNLADCYAYALAMTWGAPLLYAGEDFGRTDVARAA
jgi:ribonuclease VapC